MCFDCIATTIHRLPDDVFITRDSDEPTTQSNHRQLKNEAKQLQIDRFSNSSDRHYQNVSEIDLKEKQQETNMQPIDTKRMEELEKAFVEFRANSENLKDQLSITQQNLLYVQNTTIDLQNQLSVNKQQLSDLQRDNTYLKNQLSLTQKQLLGVQSMMTCSRIWVVSCDHFTIGKEIGRGAWATVHETTFRGATVAAKCLHQVITSPRTTELFQREMEMALQCQHQNIVTFLGATLEGPPVILMELMDTSLRSAYEHGNIKDHQVLGILCDTASALYFLHTRPDPVIHRDVSSANVLLKTLYNGEWLAKLGDLGTAKIQQQAATAGPGAIAYGAPEAADFTKHSPKMDVYSYGVLVLEVLTKTHPFQMVDALKAQVQQQFPQYRQLVTGCTNHQSRNRPTMYDVIEQLDRISIKAARP